MTAAAKTRCWEGLAAEMLAASGVHRSVQEVKRKWTYYKSDVKCGAAAGCSQATPFADRLANTDILWACSVLIRKE